MTIKPKRILFYLVVIIMFSLGFSLFTTYDTLTVLDRTLTILLLLSLGGLFYRLYTSEIRVADNNLFIGKYQISLSEIKDARITREDVRSKLGVSTRAYRKGVPKLMLTDLKGSVSYYNIETYSTKAIQALIDSKIGKA